MKEIQTIAILASNKGEFKLTKRTLPFYRRTSYTGGFLSQGNYKNLIILYLETGIGTDHIEERILGLLKDHKVDFAIATGFTGALEKEMKVGDIVIPSKISSLSDKGEDYCPSSEAVDLFRSLKRNNGFKLYLDRNHLTVQAVFFKEDKLRLKQTNPDVSTIDMESFNIARIFSKEKVPFIVIRTVSDELDFTFNNLKLLFGKKWQTNLLRFLGYCLVYPLEIANLIRFFSNLKKALKNNTGFILNFIDSLAA